MEMPSSRLSLEHIRIEVSNISLPPIRHRFGVKHLQRASTTRHQVIPAGKMATRNDSANRSPSAADKPIFDAVSSATLAFPFMKLSAELRLHIYKLAIQNTLDAVVAWTLPMSLRGRICSQCPAFIGAQALLHTSFEVRSEIRPDFKQIVGARAEISIAKAEHLRKAWIRATESHAAHRDAYVQAAFEREGMKFVHRVTTKPW